MAQGKEQQEYPIFVLGRSRFNQVTPGNYAPFQFRIIALDSELDCK